MPIQFLERFHMEVRNAGDELVCYVKFGQAWEAQRWLEMIANGTPITMNKDESAAVARYTVRSPNSAKYGKAADALATMRDIVEYKPNKDERAHPLAYSDHVALAHAMAGTKSPVQERVEALREQVQATAPAVAKVAAAKADKAAKAPSAPRKPGGKDPFAITDDMEPSRRMRRTAQRLCHEATGNIEAWKTYKPAAEKLLKGGK